MEEVEDYNILENTKKKIDVKFILVDNNFGEKSIEKYINKKIEIQNNNIKKDTLKSFLLYNQKDIDPNNDYVIKYILKFSFREEIDKLCNNTNNTNNINNINNTNNTNNTNNINNINNTNNTNDEEIKLKIIKKIDDIELINHTNIDYITLNSLTVILEKKEKKHYIKQKINNKKNITKKCKK